MNDYRQLFDTKSKSWKSSDETAFYVSTVVLSAQEFCQAIRNHWGIENRNHHVRDVTMGEDQSRIRINPNIFAKLRSFALNILRKNKVENVSLELFENCMNLDRVFNYVGIFLELNSPGTLPPFYPTQYYKYVAIRGCHIDK